MNLKRLAIYLVVALIASIVISVKAEEGVELNPKQFYKPAVPVLNEEIARAQHKAKVRNAFLIEIGPGKFMYMSELVAESK